MSKLGEKIIDSLNQYAEYPLPNYGVVAGQSVAEIYFRLKKIPIETRIKDIDLFMNLNSTYLRNKYSNYTRNVHNNFYFQKNCTKNKLIKKQTSFNEENFEVIKSTGNYYKIVDVFNIQNVNVIEIEHDKYSRLNHVQNLKNTVNSFDINSIQIGVCLRTKRVYMTEHFKTFINTKQVSVITYHRPLKTLCRYLEKQQYYKGAFFNFYYEVNLILTHFFLNKNKEKIPNINILKESYDKLNKFNQKLIQKYFKLETYKFETFTKLVIKRDTSNIDGKSIQEFYKETIDQDKSIAIIEPKRNYLIPNDDKSIESFLIKSNYFANKYLLEELVKYRNNKEDNKLTRNMKRFIYKCIDEYNKNKYLLISSKEIELIRFTPRIRVFNKNFKSNLRYITNSKKRLNDFEKILKIRSVVELLFSNKKINLLLERYSYFKNSNFLRLFNEVNKYSLDSNILFQMTKVQLKTLISHYELTKKLIIFNHLKKRKISLPLLANKIKAIEKSEHNYFIGYIESNELPLDYIFKDIKEISKIVKKMESDENNSTKKIPNELLEFKDYKINHIENTFYLKRVGNSMKHCVGGYGGRLRKKEMLFFDIYDKGNQRYTLSVYIKLVKEEYELKYDQCKMKQNKMPSKRVIKDIFEFIDKLEELLNSNKNLIV